MTADPSAAADTLRDELARHYPLYGDEPVRCGCGAVGGWSPAHLADVVRRYADAQVAAMRDTILAECDRYAEMNARNSDVRFGADRVVEAIRRIARGQP